MSVTPWRWPTSKPEPADDTVTTTEPDVGWVSDLESKQETAKINALSVAVGFVVALALSLLFAPLLFAAFL